MPLSRRRRTGLLLLLLGAGAASRAPAQGAPSAGDSWAVPPLPAPAPIAREEYAARRAKLAQRMEDGVLVVHGQGEPEEDYLTFNQRASFRYLTGLDEPGAVLVLRRRGGRVDERLYVRPRNPAREVWEGSRLGAEGAQAQSGIPSFRVERLFPALDSMLAGGATLYTLSPPPETGDADVVLTPEQQIVARLAARHPGVRVASLDQALQELRAAKSPAELDRIRRAVYITVLAQRAALRAIEPGMNEFEVQALIEYTFRRNGAERPGFATIVGSGPNSTTLHYQADDRYMQPGEVVVMDIGAAYAGYSADVTRTAPVSGTFSPEQRAVYEIVLQAQKAAEAQARPGASWQALNSAAERVLAEGLARLGLIDAPDATYDCAGGVGSGKCPQLRLFYMHGLGHGIGLDVHDPDVSYFQPFAVGSAFTIEPGLYVRADALDFLPDTPANRAMIARLRPALERYRNIGVRIEDDYFITAQGVERVSSGAPREAAEIEALMRLPAAPAAERRPEVVEWYRAVQGR